MPRNDDPTPKEDWGVLHDLAYIFLVLAQGTDDDLAETEVQVMLNKLREWTYGDAPTDVLTVLETAKNAYGSKTGYGSGDEEERLRKAIASVRQSLPHEKRMAALNDLVKIANADGVFLDNEEDLINHLLTLWDVDAYAGYGSHGSKE